MFVIKRNQVVVTALAVMIAAAGYLNFQESRSAQSNKTALQLTEEGDITALVDYSALPDDLDAEDLALDPITAEGRCGCVCQCGRRVDRRAVFCGSKTGQRTVPRKAKGYSDGNAE